MTIGRKLYSSFGAVLAMVLVLFLVNLTAVYREHSAKAAAGKALQLADASDKVRFQMMQNRLYLSNYLLSGDSREIASPVLFSLLHLLNRGALLIRFRQALSHSKLVFQHPSSVIHSFDFAAIAAEQVIAQV